MLNEIDDVLRRPKLEKYLPENDKMQFLVALVREASIVEISESITDCRDPKDNKYLKLAVSGLATCIVSGDQDLLVLNPYRDIPILTPRQFLDSEFTL
ncbi:MAG: putative PIN family toxin of toxin-antitoxin system [Candidatus Promineifilaceae bacterium]